LPKTAQHQKRFWSSWLNNVISLWIISDTQRIILVTSHFELARRIMLDIRIKMRYNRAASC